MLYLTLDNLSSIRYFPVKMSVQGWEPTVISDTQLYNHLVKETHLRPQVWNKHLARVHQILWDGLWLLLWSIPASSPASCFPVASSRVALASYSTPLGNAKHLIGRLAIHASSYALLLGKNHILNQWVQKLCPTTGLVHSMVYAKWAAQPH